jgi:RNA polymerase sigma-70 factor (ECF subfamily)
MNEYTERLTTTFLTMEEDLQREFELRIADSTTLAFRVAFGVLRNRADAEDVAQETFTRAYQNFSRLRDRERFRAWLVRVAWRLALDHRRSSKRRTLREESHAAAETSHVSAPNLVEKERAEQLWKAIDSLPEKLRIVIVLAGIEEHNVREVGNLLGLPEGTVKSRLFHARERLKELLQ